MAGPMTKGVPAGIRAGLAWAADNQLFTFGSFSERRMYDWLATMETYVQTCLFVVVPDVPADSEATVELYKYYEPDLAGWPLAFVAQDGQEDRDLPDRFDCLFVGGSTEWKESAGAVKVIKRAQALGKHIHVGRVNHGRRYRIFAQLAGSERFTCDGTRTRFDGVERTLSAWRGYMAQKPLLGI
jgi:hypothetical protein